MSLCAFAAPVQPARAAPGFYGVVSQGPLDAADFRRMRAGGVDTLRFGIYWHLIQQRRDVFDFDALDFLVEEAARNRIDLLPIVYGSPSWVAPKPAWPPLGSRADRRAWGAFVARLEHRYGPGGAFWRGKPRPNPIRRWQIWNEPNFRLFWLPGPSPRGYARLLGIASRAIRARDPEAKILLAGVAPIERSMLPWEFLRRLYRVPGVKRSFDAVAVHPYAADLYSMAYQIRLARLAMLGAGDGATPIRVSEIGVASAGAGGSPLIKTAQGQADFLRRAIELLDERRRRWRISGVDWFAWRDAPVDDPYCVFCRHAGLLTLAGEPKPAWNAFARIARFR